MNRSGVPLKLPRGVLEHITNPKNAGHIKNPDASAEINGPCGDTMQISLIIRERKIKEIGFETDGCGITVACGSVVSELAKGKSIKDVLRISPADVIDGLKGIMGGDPHCAILAVNTLHKAVSNYFIGIKP